MSFLNVTCPNCEGENAYHNGVCYVCPDCDYEWDDGMIYDDDEEEEEDDDDKENSNT